MTYRGQRNDVAVVALNHDQADAKIGNREALQADLRAIILLEPLAEVPHFPGLLIRDDAKFWSQISIFTNLASYLSRPWRATAHQEERGSRASPKARTSTA
jgi:hypothetical protein